VLRIEERFLAARTPIGMTGVAVGGSSAAPLGDGFGDDAYVGDAGNAQGIDDGGEGSEGNSFVAAEEYGVARMLELLFDFVGKLVDVDGIVAEVDALGLVYGDDEALLGDFLDGVNFGEIDFDAGLQDGCGDHEDDEEDEDDVNERHHVDVGEGGLGGFC
jgi:hypothetical protein